jgi:DNA-binding LacI/PurR family transcriptional regulator
MYRRIYDALAKEISAGSLAPGDRVPSEKELSIRYGVSRITSKRALELLSEEGIVVRFPGKGSFVASAGEGRPPRRRDGAGSIGLVLPDFSETFGLTLLFGIEDRCRELGYQLSLHRTLDRAELEGEALGRLVDSGAAGVIVLPVHGEDYNPAILRLVLDQVPLSFVDRRLRGLAASFVGTDNVGAARLGVEHLLDRGRKRIAFVSGPISNTSAIEDRREGFVAATSARGIAADTELWVTDMAGARHSAPLQAQAAANLERMRAHLATHPEIDAVFAAEYECALFAREAARLLGRRVPEDLSIVCFDSPPSYLGEVPFTHLRQSEYEMGRKALDIVHAQVLGGSGGAERVYLPAELVGGDSTARA